ncbi:MAG: tRNA (guanosine(46)-N7)-methyltransferase TrmB [Bacteroidales bacterium]|nr:tRNA (guanosine(46)-N7)-methyltransferase TrmB [Bacteroidales bacterium]MBQ1938443.1 tRNA (guanosine(46)-N7)-methyltransferase TrmB [Bacteroidales bacterium]
MGKDKLRKFAENESFRCMIQPTTQEVMGCDHPLKGRWKSDFFHNDNPIVLELGCGKGDYTVALALRNPQVNYIGVDIKGARMWKGAKYVEQNHIPNAAFLRTRIEFISSLFAPGEVSEIWITFADPQIGREKKRLTAPLFLSRYAGFLQADGAVHLKTDSRYLYEYTRTLCQVNALPCAFATHNLYQEDRQAPTAPDAALFEVQTFYEKHFLAQNYPICYLKFSLAGKNTFVSPDWDEERWKDENHHAFVIQVHE